MISKVKPVVDEFIEKPDWFETWFDSPYYHLLYKNRNEKEAENFLDSLISLIQPQQNARILDVACGKGRHSIYLNRKGFDVTGFDLSESNIRHNKSYENEKLVFYLHDMREVFRSNYFEIVLNLFSSFGYFRKEHDNIRCLHANYTALKHGGTFVFDYFNSSKIIQQGNSNSVIAIDNVSFSIKKSIDKGFITKKIHIEDKNNNINFEEVLMLADSVKLEKYFNDVGFRIMHRFGSYTLDPFDEKSSDRFILIATKEKKQL